MPDKTCFKCGERKTLSSFYRHPQTADGHLNKCKACACKDVRERRAADIENYRARERGRDRVAYVTLNTKRWRKANAQKWQAQMSLNNAVRAGRVIKKPCEVCGSTYRIHGHHDDYSKPLAVRWLCAAHHAEHHRKAARGRS